MDQSIFVGLITGTRAYPQDDLSLDDKATIILFVHDIIKREMENLVTGSGFQPFHEFAARRKGNPVAYNCKFPDLVANVRIGLLFTADTPMILRSDGCSVQFIRHSAILTTKGDLFWLAEKCVTICDESRKPISGDLVTDVDLVPLDHPNLRHYFGLFPGLFLKLLVNFRAVPEHALEMREQRQKRTQLVFEKLDRMSRMIGI